MFVEVTLGGHDDACIGRFEHSVRAYPDIVECYAISGTSDYLIVIQPASFAEAARVHRDVVTRLPEVKKVRSAFALRSVKAVR